jgi:hypothetical protein
MPDRVIRDELLTSERYWSVSIEAQRLFVHLMLCADDLGRFSGKNYTIRAACFPGQAVPAEKVEKLLSELQDSDLIRVYNVSSNVGERFIFLPRFRQRLRFKTSRYPEPPKGIIDIEEEKSDIRQTRDGHKSDTSPPKRREEKRREEKLNAFALPEWVPQEPWKAWLEVRSRNRAPNTARALQLAVNELDRLRKIGQDPAALLDRATANGWRAIWPLKEQAATTVKLDIP